MLAVRSGQLPEDQVAGLCPSSHHVPLAVDVRLQTFNRFAQRRGSNSTFLKHLNKKKQ